MESPLSRPRRARSHISRKYADDVVSVPDTAVSAIYCCWNGLNWWLSRAVRRDGRALLAGKTPSGRQDGRDPVGVTVMHWRWPVITWRG